MAKALWIMVMGIMAMTFFSSATSESAKLKKMQPVLMSLDLSAYNGTEWLEEEAKTSNYISTRVIFSFPDGKVIQSKDSTLNKHEVTSLLNGKSIHVYYNEDYPRAVFDDTELPDPTLDWILGISFTLIFVLGIGLWIREFWNENDFT